MELQNSLEEDQSEAKWHIDHSQINEGEKLKLWPQILGALAGAFCHVAIGGMYGFPGVALPQMMNEQSLDIVLDKSQASLFNSTISLGNLMGSLCAGVLMTWLGQRKCLIAVLPIGVIGWLTLAFSPSFGLLIAGRLILGLSAGVFNSTSYNYVVELAHTSVRGRLLAMIDLFRQISYTVVVIIGSSNLTWRQQAFIQTSPLLIPLLIFLLLPDSPRWLAMKRRKSAAYESLLFFRGDQYDVKKELEQICEQAQRNSKRLSVRGQSKLLVSKGISLIFLKTSVMMLLIYFGGNLVVATYSVVIFEKANVSIDPYVSSVIAMSARIFGAITYLLLSETLRRKTLFCIPLFLAGMSLMVLGLFFWLQVNHDLSLVDWIPVVAVSAFNYFTSVYFPVFMLLRGELLPNSVRSLGSGIQFFLLAADAFITMFTYPYLVDWIGNPYTFWLYGLFNLMMCTYVALFIPETKGKSLEEIADMHPKKLVTHSPA